MSLLERTKGLCATGEMSIDILTPVYKSEGFTTSQIREVYDTLMAEPDWAVRIERGIAYFHPVVQ